MSVTTRRLVAAQRVVRSVHDFTADNPASVVNVLVITVVVDGKAHLPTQSGQLLGVRIKPLVSPLEGLVVLVQRRQPGMRRVLDVQSAIVTLLHIAAPIRLLLQFLQVAAALFGQVVRRDTDALGLLPLAARPGKTVLGLLQALLGLGQLPRDPVQSLGTGPLHGPVALLLEHPAPVLQSRHHLQQRVDDLLGPHQGPLRLQLPLACLIEAHL
ncbi:hypothetical protein [Streptomyces sp. 8N616]|uniref:hypothetical protein n=1 Tax=Streptomyces sp. 8N616 TaxID=3457414 RepID=UPI003FD18753